MHMNETQTHILNYIFSYPHFPVELYNIRMYKRMIQTFSKFRAFCKMTEFPDKMFNFDRHYIKRLKRPTFYFEKMT